MNMERLSMVDPELAEELRAADARSRRRAALVAASVALEHVEVDDLLVSRALETLQQGNLDESLRLELSALADVLDTEYWTLQSAYEEGGASEESFLCAFRRARAVAAVCFALHPDDLYAALESAYEAYSAVEDGDSVLKAVAKRDV